MYTGLFSHEPHVKFIHFVYEVLQFKGKVSSEKILVTKETSFSAIARLFLSSVIVLSSENKNSAPKMHSRLFSFFEIMKLVHLVIWLLLES